MIKKQWIAQHIHDNLPTWQRDNHLSAAQVAWFQQRYPLQTTVHWRLVLTKLYLAQAIPSFAKKDRQPKPSKAVCKDC